MTPLKVGGPPPKISRWKIFMVTRFVPYPSAKKGFGKQANLSQSKDDEVKMLVGNEVHAREGNVRETKYVSVFRTGKSFALKMEGDSE